MFLPDSERSLGRVLGAGALIVAGMIILAPSSAFTIAILHYYFESLIDNPGKIPGGDATVVPFLIGVLAGLVAGGTLLWAGIRIARRKAA